MGPKQMFDATCTKCGNACQVPFKPNPDNPRGVLCASCFQAERDANPRPPRRF